MLAAADLKLKTDIKLLKERESAKKAAVDEVLERMRREERNKLRRADKKRQDEEQELQRRLKNAQESRMQNIVKNTERKKEKMKAVEEYKHRVAEEEQDLIRKKLEEHDHKLQQSRERYRECMTLRVARAKERNHSVNEKLSMFRT